MVSRTRSLVLAFLVLVLASSQADTQAQGGAKLTSPKQQFGANIGDDYFLVNYTQFEQYWKVLDRESDRMQMVDIGRTEEGRTHWMAIITSPENFKKLDRYKEISRRLAHAEGLTDDEARALAAEGKAVVWIDGGLHATEVVGAQQLIETVYQLVSRSDPETLRFLRDCIILAVHANPDGMELVSNWYMREKEPARRSMNGLPRLYQKYVGHDNNRDFYLSSQAETTNMNRILYHEWFPQIVYNHHQTGPTGTVLFAPPFRDPFNYNYDPLVPLGIDTVGAAMHTRFAAEGKPGATMRRGAGYSTWWNGGLRTTVYFHNQIGLLTEIIGHPTPMEIPFVPERQLPSADLPYPIAPQKWHFRQSIEYELTANRAVLDVASRQRENFLFNMFRMGKNSIDRGSTDTWTVMPRRLAAVRAEIERSRKTQDPDARSGFAGGFRATAPIEFYQKGLRDPGMRDARGYILPSDQPDFLTATKFMNALIKTGVTVHRATAPFSAGGRQYPAGSYVVKAAQAFRPHVRDMFEPQDHPDDIPYPGGPPTPPYDNAGWTLAFQMGVKFDRILDGFDGPFEKVTTLLKPAPGQVTGAQGAAGFLVSHHQNDAFIAVNRLLKAGEDVYWLRDRAAGGAPNGTGMMYIAAKGTTLPILQKAAAELGLSFAGVPRRPAGDALKLRPVRIGLFDRYGGLMPSGWTRWMLERYEFPFEVVYPQTIDAGNLNARFDVLIFTDGALEEQDRRRQDAPPADLPADLRATTGALTVAKSVPNLKAFAEAGGTVLAIGGSTIVGRHFGLPVADALVERAPDGTQRPLPREKYYIPGSVLRVRVDNTSPLAYGFENAVDVMFDNSPTFRLEPAAALQNVKPVAWFADAAPLRSGWAWGQGYLNGGVAVVDASVGKGKVLLFGPEINFRAQPHGTFKFLFNGILYGNAVPDVQRPLVSQ